MIAKLIRHDPAMRTLIPGFVSAFAFGLMVIVIDSREQDLPSVFGPGSLIDLGSGAVAIACLIWLSSLVFLAFGNFWKRSARFHLALPLSSREAWAARLISISIAGAWPFLVLGAVVSLRPLVDGTGSGLDSGVLALGLRGAVTVILISVLFLVPRPRLYKLEGPWYVAYCIVVWLGTMVATIWMPVAAVYSLLILGCSAIIAVWEWTRCPKGLELPAQPRGALDQQQKEDGNSQSVESEHVPWLVDLVIFRQLVNRWNIWLFLFVSAFHGFLIYSYFVSGKNALLWLAFFSTLMWSHVRQCGVHLRPLDPLPVSRRRILVHIILPVVLLLGVGVVITHLITSTRSYSPALIRYFNCEVRIPSEYWQLSWEGSPPTVTSPWGETHTPEGLKVFPGLNLRVFNPYEHGSESSPKFIDLQLARAAEAIHGTPIPAASLDPDSPLDRAYLAAIKRCSFTVAYSEGKKSVQRDRTAALVVMVGVLMSAISIGLGLLAHCGTRYRRLAGLGPVLYIVSIIGTLGFAVVGELLGLTSFQAIDSIPMIALRVIAEAIPICITMLWLSTAAVTCVCFLFLVKLFKYTEAYRMVNKPSPGSSY
jgi:hypothetical protein